MDHPLAGKHYPRSLGEVQAWFRTDADCLDYLEWLRWSAGFVCAASLERALDDAGRLPLHHEHVDLAAELAKAVADAQMAAQEATIVLSLPSDAGALRIVGDTQLLGQLLRKLVGNAVRHAPRGAPVRIEAQPAGPSVQLRFENPAPGLAAADRARFFERFFRGDAAHWRQVDGHGLGLSLAREIVRAPGGDLVHEPAVAGDDRVVLRLTLPSGDGAA